MESFLLHKERSELKLGPQKCDKTYLGTIQHLRDINSIMLS